MSLLVYSLCCVDEALKEAFSELEHGGCGAIRAHDLGTALRAIGQTPTEADIQELLQDAVLDGQLHQDQNTPTASV